MEEMTTVSRALAEKYGFELFDVDERFDEHKKMSNRIISACNEYVYLYSADDIFWKNS